MDEMSFRVRTSKFRHVYGSGFKKENCYEGLKITKNAHEGNFCSVNPTYIAIVTEVAGGGSFTVIPIENTGRQDVNAPKVCGHKGPVLDIKWNPFHDDIIASASDDATVKLWQVPERGGLTENLTDWMVDLHGHTRRVGQLEWHPTAENILLSSSYDHSCILWNVETAEPINVMSGLHSDTIYSLSWNRDGSLFSTTCKDKNVRVIDPRLSNVSIEVPCHQGTKAAKTVFINKNRLFTIGFSRMCDREFSIWDMKNMSKPLKTDVIDSSSGIMFPFFDPDTNVMFLAGKGDGNIRYYEIVDESPFAHYLSQYQSGSPQRGLGFMPKRGLDTSRCEIFRFYKLHTIKSLCEPISMIVPRKAEVFQDDIYPATASHIPSLSADEWLAGNNRDPILMSMKDGQIVAAPNSTPTHAAVRKEGSTVAAAPTITTYKAVKRGQPQEVPSSGIKRITTTTAAAMPLKTKSLDSGEKQLQKQHRVPASVQNIAKLSGTITATSTGHGAAIGTGNSGDGAASAKQDVNENDLKVHETVDVSNRIGMFENKNLNQDRHWQKSYNSPVKTEVTEISSSIATQQEAPKVYNTTITQSFQKAEPSLRSTTHHMTSSSTSRAPAESLTHLSQAPAASTDRAPVNGIAHLSTATSTTPSGSALTVVTRGYAQPLTRKNRSPGITTQSQEVKTSTTVSRTSPRTSNVSLTKNDRSPIRMKQSSKGSSKHMVNGKGTKAVCSSSSDLSDSDGELTPTQSSPVRRNQGQRRKAGNLGYRKRREKKIMNESSDISDVFTTPPMSPNAPSLKAKKLASWSENPLYSKDPQPVDISALDDALQDFEEISNKMSEGPSQPSSVSSPPFRSTPDIKKKIEAQRNKNVVLYPMSASMTNIGKQPSRSTSSEDSRTISERAVSAKDVRNHSASTVASKNGLESVSPKSSFPAYSSSSVLSGEIPRISKKVSSKSVENVLKDSKISIPNNNLLQQYGYENNEHDTSLDGLINSLQDCRFGSSPDKLGSPKSRSSITEQSTEMLDFLNTEAPDNTVIFPSKMRASQRSKRRHTTEINFKPSNATSESSSKSSPSPPKDVELSALDSALNIKTSGFQRSWQTSSFREKPVSKPLPEFTDSPFQRSNSVRDRQRRGLAHSCVEQNSKAINEAIAEYDNTTKSPIQSPTVRTQVKLELNNNSKTRPVMLNLENDTRPDKRLSPVETIVSSINKHGGSMEPLSLARQSPIARSPVSCSPAGFRSPAQSPAFSPIVHQQPVGTSGKSGSGLWRGNSPLSPTSGPATSRATNSAQLMFTTSSAQDPSPDKLIMPMSEISKHVTTNGTFVSPTVGIQDHEDNKIHVKKVWSPRNPVSNETTFAYQNGDTSNNIPNTDAELRKAYFRQLEEIRSLKEQINYKDKRIRQLEEEMKLLRCGPANIDESVC